MPIPNTMEMLVGTTHPWIIERLLDMMDSDPDVRSKLAKEYAQEWPVRAKTYFHENGEVCSES